MLSKQQGEYENLNFLCRTGYFNGDNPRIKSRLMQMYYCMIKYSSRIYYYIVAVGRPPAVVCSRGHKSVRYLTHSISLLYRCISHLPPILLSLYSYTIFL